MKLHGKSVSAPKPEVVVFPHQDGDVVFRAQAVLDYSDFEALCPEPQAPSILRPGQAQSVPDPTDPEYQEAVNEWAGHKTHWMFLKSLQATENLEWETVVDNDPSTWDNYQEELLTAGFSQLEVAKLLGIVINANGLNQDRIDEATKLFLAGQEVPQ